MGPLTIILLCVAALVVAGVTFIVIQFKTFQRGAHHNKTFLVDNEEVNVKVHFAVAQRNGAPPRSPMILRWLHVQGFAMLGHIWIWYTETTVSRVLLAHELIHRALQHIIGGPRYVIIAGFQWATQRKHNRRGIEEEARRGEKKLAETGTAAVTIAGKPRVINVSWLMDFRA